MCSSHNKFNKLYKIALSFKLNNVDFSPLPFLSVSKPVSSASVSLPFITACKPVTRSINTKLSKLFDIATNKRISSVSRISQVNFFRIFIHNFSKLSVYLPIHSYVSSYVSTVNDTLNICDVLTYVSSTHDTRKFFPSTHNFISITRHVSCLENNNIISNTHRLLTSLLPLSETKSSPLSLTRNLNFLGFHSLCLKSYLLEFFIMFLYQQSFLCFFMIFLMLCYNTNQYKIC